MQCDALLLLTKHIQVSFSWVCPAIDYEFCHNFVKVVCGSTNGYQIVDPQLHCTY